MRRTCTTCVGGNRNPTPSNDIYQVQQTLSSPVQQAPVSRTQISRGTANQIPRTYPINDNIMVVGNTIVNNQKPRNVLSRSSNNGQVNNVQNNIQDNSNLDDCCGCGGPLGIKSTSTLNNFNTLNQSYRVTYTLTNESQQNIRGPFVVRITKTYPDMSTFTETKTINIGTNTLAPGASVTGTFNSTITAEDLRHPSFTLTAVANSTNQSITTSTNVINLYNNGGQPVVSATTVGLTGPNGSQTGRVDLSINNKCDSSMSVWVTFSTNNTNNINTANITYGGTGPVMTVSTGNTSRSFLLTNINRGTTTIPFNVGTIITPLVLQINRVNPNNPNSPTTGTSVFGGNNTGLTLTFLPSGTTQRGVTIRSGTNLTPVANQEVVFRQGNTTVQTSTTNAQGQIPVTFNTNTALNVLPTGIVCFNDTAFVLPQGASNMTIVNNCQVC